MTRIVAVDPGLCGALAILSPKGELELLADLPVQRDARLSWICGNRLQSLLIDGLAGRPARGYVERVGGRPGQGVSGVFNFGCGLGSVLAILQARQLPIELIVPGVWKRAMGLSSDKRASLDKARLLFPTAELHLCKHEGRAESLLLAHWALNRRPAAVAS